MILARTYSTVTVAGVTLVADLSGALFWEEERLLVVSDLLGVPAEDRIKFRRQLIRQEREGATIGAGSVIGKDAPAGKLTVARAKQHTLDGWQRPTKKPKS